MHDLYEIAVCVCDLPRRLCGMGVRACLCMLVHAVLCPCEVTRLQMFIVAIALLAMGAVDKHARCSVLLTEHALERGFPSGNDPPGATGSRDMR